MLLQLLPAVFDLVINLPLLSVVSKLLEYNLLSLNVSILVYPPDGSSRYLDAGKLLPHLLGALLQ